MKEVKFSVGTTFHCCKIPEKWEEVTSDQFIFFVNHQGDKNNIISRDVVLYLLGELPNEIETWLMPVDIYSIQKELEWMLDIHSINCMMIDKFKLPDGTDVFGPEWDFDNVTSEEFIFADSLAANNQWEVVPAILFRPKRKNYDGETDIRIPFSNYGSSYRMDEFAKLDKSLINALKIQYILQRKKMTDKYNRIFFDAGDMEMEQNESPENNQPDWVSIIRNMMGDNWFQEDLYMKRPINSFLFHLNNLIKENESARFRHN